MLPHDDVAVVAPTPLSVFFCDESSALLRGIRKGARDLEMADSSDDVGVEEYTRVVSNPL